MSEKIARLSLLHVSIALIFCLSGCSSLKTDMTQFYPYDQVNSKDRYTFVASADIFYKDGSPEGEKARIGWLEEWLDENDLCRNGYVIDSKKSIKNNKVSKVYYVISCK